MTTEKKLQAVTEAIRKALPRLMEVGDGCKLWYEDDFNSDLVEIVSLKNEIVFIKDEFGNISEEDKSYLDIFEIIGKEPTLLDVLEFVMKTAIDDTEIFFILTNWDLSKLYLKDQSEELICFLFNLKNQ